MDDNVLYMKDLARELSRGKIAVFTGAGVSASLKFPNWKLLIKDSAEELGLTIDNTDLTQVAQFYSNKHSLSKLLTNIVNKLNEVSLDKPSDLVSAILKLNLDSIWTTNYDDIFKHFSPIKCNVFYDDKSLLNKNIEGMPIYKINGDINKPESMVITKKDFECYADTHKELMTLLHRELLTKTFLFLGYSFEDGIVLNILQKIVSYFGDSYPYHYTIMKDDNNKYFQYFKEDLESRYHIKVIPVNNHDEIPKMLNNIIAEANKRNVFISGSFDTLPGVERAKVDSFVKNLVDGLYHAKLKIITGVGKGLGAIVTGYAHEYLLNHHMNVSDYLELRPFPIKTDNPTVTTKDYRKYMMRDCCNAIFLYGKSSSYKELEEYPGKHYSLGTYQEYELARELGINIIPIPSTGYEAEVIYNDLLTQKPAYIERYLDVLPKNLDCEDLIPQIINLIGQSAMSPRL